jgi:DMSO/TMAO reductase YedYZ molybdopterin-dependent catalytic subunit
VTVTVAAAVLFFGGAVLYYPMLIGNVEQVEKGTIEVRGLVDRPYSFDLGDFQGQQVTVEAELVGDFTHEPRQNYTGVPLRAVLERASVRLAATTVHVVGADGYGAQLDFDLVEVMDSANASAFILVKAHGTLPTGGEGDYVRLVCRDLEGGWWVSWVVRVEVA